MKKLLTYFNGFEWFILLAMVLANIITGGFSDVIGAICSITGVLCVILVAKGKIANFYFGIINVALYVYISYQSRLYGDTMLNAFYYFPIQFIGIYMWKKQLDSSGTVKAKIMTNKQKAVLTLSSIFAIVVYGRLLQTLGGNVPYIDATSTVLSVIAQILMIKLFAEQWVLWMIVNVVSVIMWIIPLLQGDKFAMSMIIMWTLYLVNSIYAYINWKRIAKEDL